MLSQKVAILTYFFVLISCSKYSSRDKTTTHKQLLQKQNNNSKHSHKHIKDFLFDVIVLHNGSQQEIKQCKFLT